MYGALRVITPPAVEPVDIDLVRKHCRVDSDYDDDLLLTYSQAARDWVERWLNRALITQDLAYVLSPQPLYGQTPLVPQNPWLILPYYGYAVGLNRPVALPRSPCQSLTGVKWGAIDDLQPADTGQYVLNAEVDPARVAVDPAITSRSLQFTFKAGYGDDGTFVPAGIRQAILLLTAHFFENRGDVEGACPSAVWRLLASYRLFQFSG